MLYTLQYLLACVFFINMCAYSFIAVEDHSMIYVKPHLIMANSAVSKGMSQALFSHRFLFVSLVKTAMCVNFYQSIANNHLVLYLGIST